MSDYYQETKHPRTGVWEQAYWADNLFGHYQYGVIFPSDRQHLPEKATLEQIKTIAVDPSKVELLIRDTKP